MADAGWTTKATRQKKKNRNKPKSQQQSPNKKRLTRNQRRKRNRQNKSNGYDATDEKEPENVIDAILKKHPRLKSDKVMLVTVIEEMKLKRFDPNDAKLNVTLMDKIEKIKFSQLGLTLADENEPIEANDDDDQEEYDDDEEEDEEEEDESYVNGKDEDESVDQKESSESMREKTESTSIEDDIVEEEEEEDDDDQKSVSPPPVKKKKRRRNRKKKKQKSETPQYDEKSPEPEPLPPKPPKKEKKAKKKRVKKKKVTLSAKLNNLDFSNCILSTHQLNEWVNSLQRKPFMRSFKNNDGLDVIVGKIVMQCGDMDSNIHNEENRLLSEAILALFDVMLSGTPKYHQWLFSKLLKLSAQLKEVNSQTSNNERSTLVMVISRLAKKFIKAQMRQAQNPNDIAVDRETFQKPSDLLQSGHQEKDPIVPVLSLLDADCLKLSDMYYDLMVHGIIRDRDCPTASDEFILTYNEIKNELEENISLISAKQNSLETEMYAMQNKANTLRQKETSELSQFHDNLNKQQAERYRLLDEKRRIEAKLNEVNSELRKTDMFIEGTERDIERIASKFKPEQDRLHDNMQDHQFGIAAYSQELAVYSELLSIGNESYNLLDSWSHSMNKHDNNQQSGLENNYINQLAVYLGKLCDAKLMIRDRVDQLKQFSETLRTTNETTNKQYAQEFRIDEQLERYRKNISIDEGTSMSITNDIYMNIEKAQNAVSPDLFGKFINHIQHQQTGQMVDLSKYINMINRNNMRNNGQYANTNVHVPMNRNANMHNQNFVRQRPLRNSRHTRQSIATQTNLQRQQQQQQLRNGHAMNQQQQIQQQQTSVSPTSQQQRSKPPLISSQQQSVSTGVGVAAVRGRPPRSGSHFQTNVRQARRPPSRNHYQQSYQQ